MKKSSIYGILSIVLIVGMFFTGCASKNNASQLNTNVSNLPIHQMHASFVYDTITFAKLLVSVITYL